MSIEKMSLVTIKGERSYLDETLLRCTQSGVFHPENASSMIEYSGGLTMMKADNVYLNVIKNISEIAEKTDIDLQYEPYESLQMENSQMQQYTEELGQKVSKLLSQKRGVLQLIDSHNHAIKHLQHLIRLDYNFDDIFSCKFLKVRFGRLPLESFEKLHSYSNNPFVIFSYDRDKQYHWCMYLMPAAAEKQIDSLFQSLYFERIRIPDYAHGKPEEAVAFIQKDLKREQDELEKINGQIQQLLGGEAQKIRMVYSKAKFLSQAFELRKYASTVEYASFIKSDFVVVGFVPTKQLTTFISLFDSLGAKVAVEVKDGSECEEIAPPVKLKNNWFVRPFEMFVDMYGLPSYKGIDPTPYVAITYMLLFGIMFGDLGQGLVVALLGLIVQKKGIALGGVMSRIGLTSMVFGFLYGSVFGVETMLIPVHRALFGRDHLIEVMEPSATNFLLIAAIAIGAVIIILSISLNVMLGFREKNLERAVFSNNGLAGLVFYCAVIFAAVSTLMLGKNVLTPVYVVPLLVVPLLLMFFKEPLGRLLEKKEPFPDGFGGFFVESFFEMFEVLLSFITNTMSFIRVGSFVLVHAGMMIVVFTLSGMVGGVGSIIIAVVGNIFVMGIEGLIVGIQVLRLEFYEIFSRFFDSDGLPFQPVGVDNA